MPQECWRNAAGINASIRQEEWACALPRLVADLADAGRLEQKWRWQSENGVHIVRTVRHGEDTRRVRLGRAPRTLAAVQNAIVGPLHSHLRCRRRCLPPHTGVINIDAPGQPAGLDHTMNVNDPADGRRKRVA
jgi:hypothetical protein